MVKLMRQATGDAVRILYRRYYEGRPEHVKELDPVTIRTPGRDNGRSYVSVGKYGLRRIPLAMLNQIAAALSQPTKLRFVRVSTQLNR